MRQAEVHWNAAARHERGAETHERAAHFWDDQGDAERAALQREMAEYERTGARLERRWAELVERNVKGAGPSSGGWRHTAA